MTKLFVRSMASGYRRRNFAQVAWKVPDPEIPGDGAEHVGALEAVPHLAGGLVRERHRKNAPGRDALPRDQVGDAIRDHARLPAAGAGEDEEGPGHVGDRLRLGRIELGRPFGPFDGEAVGPRSQCMAPPLSQPESPPLQAAGAPLPLATFPERFGIVGNRNARHEREERRGRRDERLERRRRRGEQRRLDRRGRSVSPCSPRGPGRRGEGRSPAVQGAVDALGRGLRQLPQALAPRARGHAQGRPRGAPQGPAPGLRQPRARRAERASARPT